MANPTDPLGYDLKCGSDIEPGGRASSGTELVADAILHRVTTKQLPLVESENGYIEFGDDVREWIGAGLTQEGIDARAAALGPIAERDERVRQAEVSATLVTSPGSLWALKLAVTATLRTGETISRVFGVSAVTVEVLAEGR